MIQKASKEFREEHKKEFADLERRAKEDSVSGEVAQALLDVLNGDFEEI